MEKNREASFRFLDREAPDVVADLFWSAMRCDELPSGVDYYMMDTAVEYGPAQAARWLNLVLGLDSDQLVNALTVDKAANLPPHVIIAGLELHRRRRARAHPQWQINHSIFTNRCNRVRHRAVMMYDEVTAL